MQILARRCVCKIFWFPTNNSYICTTPSRGLTATAFTRGPDFVFNYVSGEKVSKFPRVSLPLLLLAVAAIAVLIIPFRIPHTIKTIGKVQAGREWQIIQADDGQISTQLLNHQTGGVERVTVTQVLRGDATALEFLPRVFAGTRVAAGDTIARIHSPELQYTIALLKGELAAEQAALRAAAAGEKPTLIEEAEQQVRLALLQAEEQKRLTDRLAELRSRQLVSIQEHEVALAAQHTYEANAAAAKARLASLQSGVKAEELGLIRVRVKALEDQIAALQDKLAAYVLCSPLTGLRVQHPASDTLLSVHEEGPYMVYLPVKVQERAYVPSGGAVSIRSADGLVTAAGRIAAIYPALHLLNGEQVLWITARMDSSSGLIPGMFVRCEIEGAPLTKIQYMQKFMQ